MLELTDIILAAGAGGFTIRLGGGAGDEVQGLGGHGGEGARARMGAVVRKSTQMSDCIGDIDSSRLFVVFLTRKYLESWTDSDGHGIYKLEFIHGKNVHGPRRTVVVVWQEAGLKAEYDAGCWLEQPWAKLLDCVLGGSQSAITQLDWTSDDPSASERLCQQLCQLITKVDHISPG